MSEELPNCPFCRERAERAIAQGKIGYVMCPDCLATLLPPPAESRPPADPITWQRIDGTDPMVRRLVVPGGWLYQVEHALYCDADGERQGYWINGWHPPVFVPEAA